MHLFAGHFNSANLAIRFVMGFKYILTLCRTPLLALASYKKLPRAAAISNSKVSGHQHRWLAGGYDLSRTRTFLEVDSMVVSWRIVAFFRAVSGI